MAHDLTFTNELTAVGDYLFWVCKDSNKTSIDYFLLSTGEQGTLQELPASSSPSLCGDSRFLTWYVPVDTGINLFYYDTQTEVIETLTEIAAADSPYTRAFVNNGLVAFLEEQEDGRLLVVYDLINQERIQTCLLSNEFMLTRLQANADYVICTEGYGPQPVYILDPGTQELTAINLDWDYYIHSCSLYEDYIMVNDNESDSLILLSLTNHTYTYFAVASAPGETNIIFSRISPDGLFYAADQDAKRIFALDLS